MHIDEFTRDGVVMSQEWTTLQNLAKLLTVVEVFDEEDAAERARYRLT
jgi:hypothetical protein